MGKFRPPESLNFDKPGEWPAWKQRFLRFASVDELSKKSGATQVSTLIYALGTHAETVFNSFTFAEDKDKEDLTKVLEKFDTYFVPQYNVIHERAVFFTRYQKQGETVEAFIRCLYELSHHCAFKDKEDMIRDRLVAGILDKTVSEELQLKSDLTLAKAIEIARHSELVKGQMSQLNQAQASGSSKTVAEVAKSRRGKGSSRGAPRNYDRGKDSRADSQKSSSASSGSCDKCGYVHEECKCPARRAKCHNCHRHGHYASQCKAPRRDRGRRTSNRSAREVAVDDSDYSDSDDPSYFLGAVDADDAVDKPWEVRLKVNGQSTRTVFKVDSGADVTILTPEDYDKLVDKHTLEPVSIRINSVGTSLQCLGKFVAKIKKGGKVFKINTYVINGARCNLLSRNASRAMGFLHFKLHEAQEVYGDIGLMQCAPVSIRLHKDAEPYSINCARRISLPLLKQVKAELDRMVKNDVIIPVQEATEWCAPIVPVPKKNGTVRICVDLKRLNNAVIREKFVLPTIDEIMPKLAGAKFFSSLDAASGFWAIPLDEQSQKLTTFITPYGRFCFKWLPFGITSAPKIFQRIMSDLLCDQEGVSV